VNSTVWVRPLVIKKEKNREVPLSDNPEDLGQVEA